MKQILQSLKTGSTEVIDVPVPNVSPGSLLIKTSKTLISTIELSAIHVLADPLPAVVTLL